MSVDKQIPRHVAIIMDGNGRWAEANGLSRPEGHAEGARAVREAVRTCCEEGVEYLTLYAFSVANWGRPRMEVRALMNLLLDFAEREKHELFERDVRLSVIGDVDELPMSTRHALDSAMSHTANCRTMTLSLALSYGGRADIVNAARSLAARAKSGEILPEEVTEELLRQEMSTHALPPVDLLVRTGGEFRVSDFLLFEAAYAELCFLPIMWPDFDAQALRDAFEFFRGRERRFGLTSHQAQSAVTGVFKRGQTFDPVDSSNSRIAKEAANAEPR